MSWDRHPLLAPTLRHFEKLILLLALVWLGQVGTTAVLAAEPATPAELLAARDALLQHLQASTLPEPRSPGWVAALERRMSAPAVPAAWPGWLAHRRPGYVYQQEQGPGAFTPLHRRPAAPQLTELRPGQVQVTWQHPECDGVVLGDYEVQRCGADEDWTALGQVPAKGPLRFVDDALPLVGGPFSYRVISSATLDDEDARTRDGVEPFPARQQSPAAQVEVTRRLYVVLLGVVQDDALERTGVAQGEVLLWSPERGRFQSQWFSAHTGDRVGRGAFDVGITVREVWSEQRDVSGVSVRRGLAKLDLAGLQETVREGERPDLKGH